VNNVKITIETTAEEMAALVVGVQARQNKNTIETALTTILSESNESHKNLQYD